MDCFAKNWNTEIDKRCLQPHCNLSHSLCEIPVDIRNVTQVAMGSRDPLSICVPVSRKAVHEALF